MRKFFLAILSCISILCIISCNDRNEIMPNIKALKTNKKEKFTSPIKFEQTIEIQSIQSLIGKTKSMDIIGADYEEGFSIGRGDGEFPKINWKVGKKQTVAYAIRRRSNPSQMLYGFLNGVVSKDSETGGFKINLSGSIRVREDDKNSDDFQIAMFIGGSIIESEYNIPESRSINDIDEGSNDGNLEGDQSDYNSNNIDPTHPITVQVRKPSSLIGGIKNLDIPLYSDWSDISINSGNGFTISSSNTIFKPWGSIIGIQFENVGDNHCILSGISVATKKENYNDEIFSPSGIFKFGQQEPSFEANEGIIGGNDSDFAGEKYYKFNLKNRPIDERKQVEGSSNNIEDLYLNSADNSADNNSSSKTKTPIFYFWVKPIARNAQQIRIGCWGVSISKFDQSYRENFEISKKETRWSPKKNAVIENGRVYVYRIKFTPNSKGLVDDVMITEVYHCVADAGTRIVRPMYSNIGNNTFNDDDTRNYSIVEIYNPTNQPIDLGKYRLVAARPYVASAGGGGKYHRTFVPNGVSVSNRYDNNGSLISKAVGMNLAVIPQFDHDQYANGSTDENENKKSVSQYSRLLGDTYLNHESDHDPSSGAEFPVYAKYLIYPKNVDTNNKRSIHEFYRRLYLTGSLMLPPKKTALYLAAGYWEPYENNGKKINETNPDDEYVGVGEMFNITKRNGDIAFAVIVNNRRRKYSGKESSIEKSNRGTLDVQADQGFLLLKISDYQPKTRDEEIKYASNGDVLYCYKDENDQSKGLYYKIIDQTGPWLPGNSHGKYLDISNIDRTNPNSFHYQFYYNVFIEKFMANNQNKRFFYSRKPHIATPYLGKRWNHNDWIYSSNKNMIGASIGARYRYWGTSAVDISNMEEGE